MTGVELMRIVISESEKKGITRYRIAKTIGVENVQVQRWFKGDNMPSIDNFAKLCKAVGIQIELKIIDSED